ncbi:P-type DNA transfer protein VirB5 [Xanthomonas campestris pv. campestris]|nr:P-type DNA transfer protein VirB5 [Xanthomonas campestris pv. campestris]MEB2059797.1 P-type DNA transfer protein VirB5 [Xanthomonas campestris pv. campestris]
MLAASGAIQCRQSPVTDVAMNTQTQMNQTANFAKYVEQVAQLKNQLEQAKQQYEALTGSRGLGDLFNNPALRQYLPQDWTGLYDAVQRGDVTGISGKVQDIIDKNKSGSIADMYADVSARQERLGAVNKATGLAGFDAAMKRADQIQSLIGQINGTSDPKAIAELQARIAGEQAQVSNEMVKLQLVSMLQQAEEKAIAAKADAVYDKQMSGSNDVPRMKPRTF